MFHSNKKNMTQDTLEFLRSDEGKSFFVDLNNQQRRRFSQAYDAELLFRLQNVNDLQIISESILQWISKINKNDSRYATLAAMRDAILRIYCYSNSLEVKTASAISEYQIFREKNTKLLEENSQLKDENESLKKQVEYYENNDIR